MSTITRLSLALWAILTFSSVQAVDRINLREQPDQSLLPYVIGASYVLDDGNRKIPVADPFQVIQPSRPGDSGLMAYACNGDLSRELPAALHFSRPDDFQVLGQLPILGTMTGMGLYTDSQTDEPAVIAACYRNDSAFAVRVRPSTGYPEYLFLTSGKDNSDDGLWEGLTHVCLISDYDLDGRTEAFLHVGPGYDLEPRTLFCVELETMRIEWSLPVASLLWRGMMFTLPDSTDPGVLFVTYNPCNGAEDANFFDCFTYLARVNGNGEVSYRKVLSFEHGGCGLWPDESGSFFYVFHGLSFLEPDEITDSLEPHYQLTVIDRHCRAMKSFDLPDRLAIAWNADYNGDGTPDLYTLSTGGIVRVYDTSFALLAETNRTGCRNYLGSIRLSGEKSPVFVLNSGQGVSLFTHRMEKLAQFDRPVDYVQPVSYDADGNVSALAGAHQNASYILSLRAKGWGELLGAYVLAYREALLLALVGLLLVTLVLSYLRTRTLRRLNESEARYRTLIEGAGEAIFLVDGDGVFILVNEVAAGQLGQKVSDCVGKTMWELFPKVVADRHMEGIARVLTTGESFEDDNSLETPGGSRYYRTSLRLVKGSRSGGQYVLGIAKDVTDLVTTKKQLEDERDFIQSLITTSNSLIFCLDKDARIMIFNDECVRVTGYSREEAIGQRWPELCLRPEDRHPGLHDFASWVREHPTDSYEGVIVTRAGEERVILWSNSVVFGNGGEDFTAIAVGVDITERKQAEQALREWNVFSRALIQESPLGISVRSRTGRLLTANKAWQRIWTVSDELLAEYKAKEPKELSFDDRDAYLGDFLPKIERVYRHGGQFFVPELKLFSRRSGETRWVSQYFYAITEPSGAVDRVVIVTDDITARKRAEEEVVEQARALAESESQFHQLAEMAPVGIVIVQDDKTVYANPEALRIFGLTMEQLQEMHFAEPFAPEFRERVRQGGLARQKGKSSQQSFEARLISQTGEERWAWMRSETIEFQGKHALLGIGVDITPQKRAAMALRDSEAKYRRIVENLFDAIIVCDDHGRISYVTPSFRRILGYSSDEVVGRSVLEFLPESQVERYRERLNQVLAGRAIDRVEMQVLRQDGAHSIVQTHTVPLFENGFVVGVQMTWRDVTGQREAEHALVESEEKFRLIAEASHDVIFLTDLDTRILYVSPSALRLGIVTNLEVGLKYVRDLVEVDERPKLDASFRSMADGRTVEGIRYKFTRPDGTRGLLEFNSSPLFQNGKPVGTVGIGRDITERLLAEERLSKARRQRDLHVRQISGGLAHEVYNSLYPVVVSLHKLRSALSGTSTNDDARSERLLNLSEKAVGRALALTELVNIYARLDHPVKGSRVEIATVVREVFEQSGPRLSATGVDYELKLEDGWTVDCHREQLFSLFNNLLMNALDALVDRPTRRISVEFKRDGGTKRIIFSDTGRGIPPDILPRIFAPFFTTNPRSGTGMGLAVVERVLEICGARAEVNSIVDIGTTIVIFLEEAGTM